MAYMSEDKCTCKGQCTCRLKKEQRKKSLLNSYTQLGWFCYDIYRFCAKTNKKDVHMHDS